MTVLLCRILYGYRTYSQRVWCPFASRPLSPARGQVLGGCKSGCYIACTLAFELKAKGVSLRHCKVWKSPAFQCLYAGEWPLQPSNGYLEGDILLLFSVAKYFHMVSERVNSSLLRATQMARRLSTIIHFRTFLALSLSSSWDPCSVSSTACSALHGHLLGHARDVLHHAHSGWRGCLHPCCPVPALGGNIAAN